jgi:hypothetical protein
MLGCTRRWRSQRLYPIDTVQDRPAACAANDGGECGASNFGVRAEDRYLFSVTTMAAVIIAAPASRQPSTPCFVFSSRFWNQ